jgi:hypothetical protein
MSTNFLPGEKCLPQASAFETKPDGAIQCSISQYEAHFRKRNQPKNLKKEEWRGVHAKLGELSAMNIKARVNLSGTVLSCKRVERSRRHAFSGFKQFSHTTSNGTFF